LTYRILIICTGNTCRSAMAEGILKRMLAEIGETEVEVGSAGVGTYSGWEASGEAIRACEEMQVDISGHRSRALTLEMSRRADLILTMEQMHSDRISELDPMSEKKVHLLGTFDPKAPRVAIDDPVGQPIEVFRHCGERLFTALKGVTQKLTELKKEKAALENQVARVALGADHRGFELKQSLIEFLSSNQYEVADCGTHGPESADYPDHALAVGRLVSEGKVDRGILICGNGIGMGITANKVPGAYAAVVGNEADAKQCRQHNGANILCLGADSIEVEQAQRIVNVFLTTETVQGEGKRYERRRKKIRQYEADHLNADLDEEE